MNGAASLSGISVRWSSLSDVGLRRPVNEDSELAVPPIFLVADGMGGHEAGDVASAMAVSAAERVANVPNLALVDIDQALRSVNTAIFDAGRAAHLMRGMGTTAVGLVLVDNGGVPAWLVLNVGDSRAYLFADGVLEQLSTDHSYVQELVDAGTITADAARRHPDRNVVTRALGVDVQLQPDYWLREPAAGQRFLLCSDGLTSELEDADIQALLARHGDPDVAAAALVEHALDAGGNDNVTVMLVDVVSVDSFSDDALVNTAPRVAPPTVPTSVVEGAPRAARSKGGRSSRQRRRSDVAPPAEALIESVPTVDEIVESSPHLLDPQPQGEADA